MTDLTYTQDGMFTRFIPENTAGETVWRQMYEQHGAAAVFNFEAARVIAEMRKAGYKIAKAKPVKLDMSDDELLAALGVQDERTSSRCAAGMWRGFAAYQSYD